MRYIGIDYGTKKVGIALSNEEGTMAFPHSVLANDERLFDAVMALVNEHRANVVLGDSRDYSGVENPVARNIRELGERLSTAGVSVAYEPEWLTSRQAERIQGRTPLTDAAAAALILDGYLTRIKNTQ